MKILKTLSASISQPNKSQISDEYATFGQYIAECLRKMDPRTSHIVQHNINRIIFDAQMGLMNYPGVPVNQQQQQPFPQQQYQMFPAQQLTAYSTPQPQLQQQQQILPLQHEQQRLLTPESPMTSSSEQLFSQQSCSNTLSSSQTILHL